jgi:hypothetical protein
MPRRLSLEYLAQRWAEVRLMGLWNLLFAPLVCVPLVGSALLIGQGIGLLHADVPGSVTITDCESTEGGWNCDGWFIADDGSVRIDRVRLYPFFAEVEQPTGMVAARVSGADANRADWSEKQTFPVPL